MLNLFEFLTWVILMVQQWLYSILWPDLAARIAWSLLTLHHCPWLKWLSSQYPCPLLSNIIPHPIQDSAGASQNTWTFLGTILTEISHLHIEMDAKQWTRKITGWEQTFMSIWHHPSITMDPVIITALLRYIIISLNSSRLCVIIDTKQVLNSTPKLFQRLWNFTVCWMINSVGRFIKFTQNIFQHPSI